MSQRIAVWVGFASLDAVVRLLMQVFTVALLARLLTPLDFGTASLVLTVIATLCVVTGGIPFEETLSQRRVVRRAHYEMVLSVCWIGGAVLTAAVWFAGDWVGAAFGEPRLRLLLTVACGMVFINAYLTLVTVVARRTKRFTDLAFANLIGNIVAGIVAVSLGVAGAGIWALLAFRAFMILVPAIVLSFRLRLLFRPGWAPARLRQIRGFSGVLLLDRTLETVTHLVLSYGVGALYGVTTLGYVNIAVRIIAPIRAAIGSISHNLTFPFFRAAATHAELETQTLRTISIASLGAAPAFLGLAAVSHLLILTMAGYDWIAAAPVVALMGIGASLTCSIQNVHTATTARGRPQTNLVRQTMGLAFLCVGLVAFTPLGVLAAGLARLMGDIAETGCSLFVARRDLGLSWSQIATHSGAPWIAAAAMALVIHGASLELLLWLGPWGALATGMLLGVVVYGLLIVLFLGPARRMVFNG